MTDAARKHEKESLDVQGANDSSRPALDIPRLEEALVENGPYSRIYYSAETGSTNTDLVARAREGAPAWSVEFSEYQTAGRGRMGRSFGAPPRSQIILSVLIRPSTASVSRLGTMSLAVGLALVDALGADTGVRMKWPNDLVLNGKKLCGILSEAVDLGAHPAVVVGVGLNVSLESDELPVPHASSLKLENIDYDRDALTEKLCMSLYRRLTQWERNDPRLMVEYRNVCATLGQEVRALLPGDKEIIGIAQSVNNEGHLIIEDTEGELHEMSVGDVIHLRQKDQWTY